MFSLRLNQRGIYWLNLGLHKNSGARKGTVERGMAAQARIVVSERGVAWNRLAGKERTVTVERGMSGQAGTFWTREDSARNG